MFRGFLDGWLNIYKKAMTETNTQEGFLEGIKHEHLTEKQYDLLREMAKQEGFSYDSLRNDLNRPFPDIFKIPFKRYRFYQHFFKTQANYELPDYKSQT